MLLQKEKQSIEEIGKKDKKIYERRKVSLSNIYDLLFPQKSRKYFRTNAKEHIGEVSSVKVSFCTSFRGKIKKGSLAVETALVLPLFFLGMVTLISFMDIYKLQTEHLTALCTKAKQAGANAKSVLSVLGACIKDRDEIEIICEGVDEEDLAAQTGHSLGIVNRSLKELISEGYLDEEIRPTEKALREAKEKAPKNAIILAAGFGMRMVPLSYPSS